MQLLMLSRYVFSSLCISDLHSGFSFWCFIDQALPLVSTLWGIILFGVYQISLQKTHLLLTAMLFAVARFSWLQLGTQRHNNANAKNFETILHNSLCRK
jgi:hypothetical protein